jgi:hypothetical protein
MSRSPRRRNIRSVSRSSLLSRLTYPLTWFPCIVLDADDLMEQARAKFDNMLSNQSRTLKEAVAEYKRRYGIPPPKGFEAWWKFCVDKDIKIVDDVSLVSSPIAYERQSEADVSRFRSSTTERSRTSCPSTP